MSLAFLGYTGRDRFAAALRELDVASGSSAAMHLVIACAWLFSFGIGRAPEGILFGALIGVSLVRLPQTLPMLAEVLKSSKPVLICMGLLLYIGVSAAWSPSEVKADWYPPRHMLYPVLLAPLLGRWRVLVWAYLAGITFQASWILIEYALVKEYQYGYPLGSSSNVHFWGGHMATASMLAACLALDGTRRAWPRALAVAAVTACIAAAVLIAGRTIVVALVIGMAAAGTWGAIRIRMGWKIPTTVLACIIVAGITFSSTFTARFQESLKLPSESSLRTRIHEFTSLRTWMWEITLTAWRDHPWCGWGRDAWVQVFQTRIKSLPPSEQIRPPDALEHLNTAHNTYLQALIDQGAIGFGMVVAALGALVACACRSRSILAMPLMALTAYWSFSSLMLSELNTSHGLIPFGLMMTFALATVIFPNRGDATR